MYSDKNKTPPTNYLQTELDHFNKIKPQLLATDKGRFAVIKGNELSACWDTYADALKHGYDKFGLNPFLVKQILETDPVYTIFSLTEEMIGNRCLV